MEVMLWKCDCFLFLFRREVEEMEEKLQLRQMAEEEELGRKREILEKMQAEAEKMKKEAEMVRLPPIVLFSSTSFDLCVLWS